jgi:hypothetical protein
MEEPEADVSDFEVAVELYNKHHDDKVALDEDGEFENMDDYEKVRQFGVELSEDLNTLTIKAIDRDGTLYYPNVIGVDNLSGMYILEKPIISDVVLTRGWSETDTEVEETPAVRSVSKSRTAYKVAPEYKPNLMKYSKRSVFEKTEKRNTVKVDYKFVSYDQLMMNLEKFKNR